MAWILVIGILTMAWAVLMVFSTERYVRVLTIRLEHNRRITPKIKEQVVTVR